MAENVECDQVAMVVARGFLAAAERYRGGALQDPAGADVFECPVLVFDTAKVIGRHLVASRVVV
jgi:hypothetical protein